MEKNTPPPRRRAPKACAFCRRRKFRCDNERPKCANCKTYAQECIYLQGPDRPRPTKARLSRLEEENEQLRQRLGHIDLPLAENEQPPKTSMGLDGPSEDQQPTVNRSQSTVSRIFISPNGDSSYHGLTSTLFDDAPTYRRAASRSLRSQVPAEHIRKQLLGEAAYQRQMELLNFQEGKLDFDGVDPDLGMHLLSLHWNRQHHSFLITYRPAFMRDMATGGPYFSKLLLNAIYFGASKFSNRPEVRRDPEDVRTAGWKFRMRVKELLGSALDRSEMTTIQALLVMTSSLFALGDERSAAWLYSGTAFRMIIDLGMHVDATALSTIHRLSDEAIEIRRRVFWGAFVVDKIQSLYQGRPASLQDFDTNVSFTFMDRYEELEHWEPFAYSDVQSYDGSPAYSVSTFTELCKLSLILNAILNKVYSERSSNRSSEELIATLNGLDAQLKEWDKSLPSFLRFGNGEAKTAPPPHVISLLALYNVLLILLHRPFVAEGHLHTTDPSVAIGSFSTCTIAASRIMRLLQAYDDAFSIRHAPYLISYATYVAASIHVRVAAQRGGGSRAHTKLRSCIDIFQKNQETNWAVRRAKKVILNLMDRMGVDISDVHLSQNEISAMDNSNGITGQDIQNEEMNTATTEMTPPETDTSELDMDVIIQSFIRQGNKPFDGHASYKISSGSNAEIYSNPIEMDVTVPSGILPTEGESSIDTWLSDDMLFGFNGTMQDDVLYQ